MLIAVITTSTIFFVTALIHVIIYKFFVRNIRSIFFFPISVIIFGCLVIINPLQFNIFQDWPLSVFFLYTLLCLNYAVSITSPLLGDVSPTVRTLAMLKSRGPLSELQIMKESSDELLVIKRLNEMQKTGVLVSVNQTYRISASAQGIYRIVKFYRRLLGGKQTG